MSAAHEMSFVDMHTAGEPVRIVTGGYPDLAGNTVLAQRRDARDRYDRLRRALMLEPRGHAGMYGVIPVRPSSPDSVMGVLFTHQEGYSTMCGHATIALGRWIVESGRVPAVEPVTRFVIEPPCGPVAITCTVKDGAVTHVSFESVPAFVLHRDHPVERPALGRSITVDIAYGGAYYAILPSARLGLDFFASSVADLTAAAADLTASLRRSLRIEHPGDPDLGFLYGTILTDDAPPGEETWNLCVFAEGQIDRSPTGSGVTARMALDHARGLVAPSQGRIFRGITGQPFSGRISRLAATGHGVHVEVGGQGHYSGEGRFVVEAGDPLGYGFELPRRFGDLRRG